MSLPVSKQRIFSFKGVQEGDYLAEHQWYVHHYLVESVSSDCSSCTVIESWQKKIQRKTITDSIFQVGRYVACYKLKYDSEACVLDTKSLIADAKKLIGQRLWKSQYSRKKFVHFVKTGKEPDAEINLTNVPDACLLTCDKEEESGKPLSIVSLNNSQALSKRSLKEGDHIISNCSSSEYAPLYRSHLVVDINVAENTIKTMTLKGSVDPKTKIGIIEEELKFQELINPHKVQYSSSLSPMMAVNRAKERLSKQGDDKENFHSWNNNSHLFVSWCMTGEEDSMTDILKTLRAKEEDNINYPVLFRVPVRSGDEISEGDHVVCNSEHYLVKEVKQDTFNAYTLCNKLKCILKVGVKITKGTYKVDYGDFQICSPEEALQKSAETMLSNSCTVWKCSSKFVTEMKCSVALFIDERCLIDNDISLSYTSISPNRHVDVGDHLLIKPDGSERFHSALVYKRVDQCKFLIVPPLPQASSDSDEVDFSPSRFAGVAYRIDYSQSLPQNEILKRAQCKFGMSKQQDSSWDYVTWAKVGKSLPAPNISTITCNDHSVLMEENRNVHQYYERILSLSEIQKGDHIFVDCIKWLPFIKKIYRKHMLVTECTEHSTVFKVAFCLRTVIQETDIDLKDQKVYRIKYVDELSAEDAVKRAREKVGKRSYGPLDRLWFVPWCKANSDSVEVSLLPYHSKPKSKSRISSFTQLNPGDYLVKQSKLFNHHYLVLSVESPSQCTVCESQWRRIRRVNLKLENESQIYFRINYEAPVCFKRERSIEHAKALLGSWDLRRKLTCVPRQRFIHYLKTGEDAVVNVAGLRDDHFMSLELECIVSLSQLKHGDHLCQCIGNKVFRLTKANHHMMVDDPNSSNNPLSKIKVLHYQLSRGKCQKGAIVNEEINVFERGELYRIPYPDRNDPKEAIEKLKQDISTNQNNNYNLISNNCEHLVTGVITGVAFSAQVENAFSKLIKFSRSSLKNHVSKLASHGSRDAAVHSSTHHAAKSVATKIKSAAKIILIKSPMIKAAAITGGVTLAVSLLIDYPMLMWHIYKLYRQRKFNVITEVEMKREVLKAVVEFGIITIFSVVGVVVGQLFCPIPVVGALAGGVLGIIVGLLLGKFVGWMVSIIIFREKRPTSLPMIVHRQVVRSPW